MQVMNSSHDHLPHFSTTHLTPPTSLASFIYFRFLHTFVLKQINTITCTQQKKTQNTHTTIALNVEITSILQKFLLQKKKTTTTLVQ